jgi:hypothetical protein
MAHSLIDCISNTSSQACNDLQSLVTCLDGTLLGYCARPRRPQGKEPQCRSALKHNLFRRLRAKLLVSIDPSAGYVTGRATMAEHDLTAKLAKSMDRHLVFPLLEWLSAKELYPEDQIQQGKLDLLNKTNMLDYAMEIFTQLNNRDPPQELKERRTEVVQNLRKLQVSNLGSRDRTG